MLGSRVPALWHGVTSVVGVRVGLVVRLTVLVLLLLRSGTVRLLGVVALLLIAVVAGTVALLIIGLGTNGGES